MATHTLVDVRCILGITACTKHKAVDGTSFVKMLLDVSPASSCEKINGSSSVKQETIALELALPQFYHFLAEMEEARVALRSAEQ